MISGGGDSQGWIQFDLGQAYHVNGAYVWNYNEAGDWRTRGISKVQIFASQDGRQWETVGEYNLALAPGTPDYIGQVVPFGKVVPARYFKLQSLGNYRNGEQTGLSEIRFSNADAKAAPPEGEHTPKYPRPTHPKPARGQPLAGAENIIYPSDAGIVDVTKAPYYAKGDGVTDDTATIQKRWTTIRRRAQSSTCLTASTSSRRRCAGPDPMTRWRATLRRTLSWKDRAVMAQSLDSKTRPRTSTTRATHKE